MASLKEAFTGLDATQSEFYIREQTKYQEVEPNRFLPDKMKGNLGPSIVGKTLAQFNSFDPYLGKTKNSFTGAGMGTILQGEAPTTQEEIQCREYQSLNGLEQLIRDTAENPNMPVRCGWRYKRTPGLVPEVAQAALGTRIGPLNNNAKEDQLGNGVKWFWNLKDAQKQYLKDIANTLPTGDGLDIINNIAGGDYAGKFGYCTTLGRMIPINPDGSPKYPLDPTMNCASANIITDTAKIPDAPSSTNPINSMQQASVAAIKDCLADPKAPLTRDCLLKAIKLNGCSDEGTLYQSLQLASGNSSRWDGYLSTQPSFQAYQSRQGDNQLTTNLFIKDRGSWEMAIAQVKALNGSMKSDEPYVRVSSRDLCLESGLFDSYDFCADITDSTSIESLDLKCLQNYWQENNGKPAGTAYPTKKGVLDSALGAISTWGDYKQAVMALKEKTKSGDPVQQRIGINQFYGVRVSTGQFSPTNLDGSAPDTSAPCLGLGKPSKVDTLRVYTEAECKKLNGAFTLRKGEDEGYGTCLRSNGTSFSFDCKYLNAKTVSPLEAWYDAADGATIIMDSKNQVRTWRDKSGKGRTLEQIAIPNRAVYTKENGVPGLKFKHGKYDKNYYSWGSYSIQWKDGSRYPIPLSDFPSTNTYTIFIVAKEDESWDETFGNPGNWIIGPVNQDRTSDWWDYDGCIKFGTPKWYNWPVERSMVIRDKQSGSADWYGRYTRGGQVSQDLPNGYNRRNRPLVWSMVRTSPTDARVYFNGGGGLNPTDLKMPRFNDQINPTNPSPLLQVPSNRTQTCSQNIMLGPGPGFAGTIYEIMIYSSALSDVERQKVEGFLSNKWGFSQDLYPGHPYQIAP